MEYKKDKLNCRAKQESLGKLPGNSSQSSATRVQ